MHGTERPNVFRMIFPEKSWPNQEEGIEEKIRRAYLNMKKREMKREKRRKRGNGEWKPELNEKGLVKTHPISDAVRGITSKFLHLFQRPHRISKVLSHSAYELRDDQGKVRGEFNRKQLNNTNKNYTPKQRNQRRVLENEFGYDDRQSGNVRQLNRNDRRN